jgi:hypothetical protein
MSRLGFRIKRSLPVLGRLYLERDRLRALLQPGPTTRIDLREPFLDFLDMVRPRAPVGLRKIRVGSACDGGYVMLDDFDGITNGISAGIGDNDDWDVDLTRRGIPVLQLDPTITKAPTSSPLLTFRRLALSPKRVPGKKVNLAELVKELPGDLVLKADIEDAEWPVFAAVNPTVLRSMRQILVEFHSLGWFSNEDWRLRALTAVKKISYGHQSVHLHGNNSGGMTVIGGIPFPQVFEVTFVRKDRCAFADDDALYPTDHDNPNLPHLTELHLGRIGHGPHSSLPRP